MCLGGAVGSTAQQGNWGPGLHWYERPALNTSGRLSPSGWGPLVGFSSLDGGGALPPAYFCKRPANYTCEPGSGGFFPPSNGVGYWCASIDQMSGYVWIETPTRQGIATFGRMLRANRKIWYEFNPRTFPDGEYYDRGNNNGNSYKAGVKWPSADDGKAGTDPAGLIFDTTDALAVMRGAKAPYDVPIREIFDWRALWNWPLRPGTPAPYGVANYPNAGSWSVFDSPQGQPCTSAYDPPTGRIVHCLPSTQAPTGNFPTFQVLDVAA
jgi:hypothetical protein